MATRMKLLVGLAALLVGCGGAAMKTPDNPSPASPNPVATTRDPTTPDPTTPGVPATGNVTLRLTHADGSPRSAHAISYDAGGHVSATVAIVGSGSIAIVDGGAVTAVDDDAPHLVTWLALAPGEALADSEAAPPAAATATGSVTPRAADIANVGSDVRFLRAKVAVRDGATLLADAELSATPSGGHAGGTLELADGPAGATAARALILYDDNATAESPSSWIFNRAPAPASTAFDAAGALPFIAHAAVTVAADGRVAVAWQPSAPLSSVSVGKILVTWHDGSSAWSSWEIRFPYRADSLTLPALPADFAARQPAPTGTLEIYAEVALLEFARAADGDAFRRDPSVFGSGIVGAVRDLDQLGGAGVTRLTFDTPF